MGIIAAVLFSSTLLSLPAHAVNASQPSLPSDWTLYTISCTNNNELPVQLYSLNASNGVAAAIGDAATNGNATSARCLYQGTFDPVTKTSYFYGYPASSSDDGSFLASMDVSTGQATRKVQLTIDQAVTADSSGTLYSTITGSDYLHGLVTINLATGEKTPVGSATLPNDLNTRALAVNPKDGKIYTFTRPGYTGPLNIVTIDKSTGALTDSQKDVAFGGSGQPTQTPSPNAMAIDSNGIAWIVDLNISNDGGLIAVDLSTGESWVVSANIAFPNAPLGGLTTQSLWLVGPDVPAPPAPTPATPELASTGSPLLLLPLWFGAGLVLAGAGLWLLPRRRTV